MRLRPDREVIGVPDCPMHPHEPDIPPALDPEGRCLVCKILTERDRYRNALDAILAEAREADDGWMVTTCEEAIQGA